MERGSFCQITTSRHHAWLQYIAIRRFRSGSCAFVENASACFCVRPFLFRKRASFGLTLIGIRKCSTK